MPLPRSNHPASGENAAQTPRLVGWKEIAAYLDKADRTVKRWGRDRGLPVHRVPGGASASVYAYPAELDQWLKLSKASGADDEDRAGEHPAPDDSSAAAYSTGPSTPRQPARASWLNSKPRWALALLGSAAVVCAFTVIGFSDMKVPPHRPPALLAKEQPKSGAVATPGIPDAEMSQARDYYLKGRYEWNQRTPGSLNRALDFFTQAIVHDPGYAQAYAGLADTYELLREYSTMPESVAFPRAIAAARKAVALDDSLAEAHRALAFAEMYGAWDFADAEKEFRRAIELNPNDAQARRWYASAFAVPGHFSESLTEIGKAQELDPSSHSTLADKGVMLYDAGRSNEAIETLKEVERSAPEFRSPHYYLMRIYLEGGDYPAYLAEGKMAAETTNDPVLAEIVEAARAGYQQDGARGLLNRLYLKQKEYYTRGKLTPTILAMTCALMGRKQEAIRLLEESFNRHDADVLAVLSNPGLLTLKEEPRYKALLKKINFPGQVHQPSPDYLAAAENHPMLASSDVH